MATNRMELEHDLSRERPRGIEWVGGQSRERRMHELGMEGRDDKPGERDRMTGEPIHFSYVVIPLRTNAPFLIDSRA